MSDKKKSAELIPDPQKGGWKVKHDGKEGDQPNGPNKYPDIVLDKDSGPQLIILRIPENSGAKFKAGDPIWVQEGTGSPTNKAMDDQIAAMELFDDGQTLVLLDVNSAEKDLSYRVEASGYGPVLDPIIKNGGGTGYPPPPTYVPPSYSFAEIGIAALALIVALLVGVMVGKRI